MAKTKTRIDGLPVTMDQEPDAIYLHVGDLSVVLDDDNGRLGVTVSRQSSADPDQMRLEQYKSYSLGSSRRVRVPRR